jgi:predicted RNA-binding Zn ribbon-like protein
MAILTVMGIDLSWADLVGGRLSLDFVNTLGDRLGAAQNEHLADYATLVAWAVHAGALDAAGGRRLTKQAAASPRAAAAVVEDAMALREAIYRMVLNRARAPHATDLARLNRELARASAEPHVAFHDGRYQVGWIESDELTAPLDAIVRDAVDLLTDADDCTRVRQCESAQGCGWIFLDCTKGRTRRWCDMKVCGNRAKARRHYARRKAEG